LTPWKRAPAGLLGLAQLTVESVDRGQRDLEQRPRLHAFSDVTVDKLGAAVVDERRALAIELADLASTCRRRGTVSAMTCSFSATRSAISATFGLRFSVTAARSSASRSCAGAVDRALRLAELAPDLRLLPQAFLAAFIEVCEQGGQRGRGWGRLARGHRPTTE